VYTQVYVIMGFKAKLWTLKVDSQLDQATQRAVRTLGYTGKAELTREAVREFLIRRNLFELLGGEPIIPSKDERPSERITTKIIERLRNIQDDDLREEVSRARTEVERELLGGEGS